ncbi:hypothetical protein NW807_10775 [Synechococcus sp. R70.1]|uniref:hypothetical protein n=1 Tax=Synechococcus sp. R70.1 TaxID=2964531 RepID=UPI0039C0DBBD
MAILKVGSWEKLSSSCAWFPTPPLELGEAAMANYNRGIMQFKGADSPIVVLISASVVAGVVSALIWWALHFAYAA